MGARLDPTTPQKLSPARVAQLGRYLEGDDASIDGWLADKSRHAIQLLAEHQLEQGLTGAIGEIGVHDGRLFVLLKLTSLESEPGFAVDVFEQPADVSGPRGDRAVFESNLRRFGIAPAEVTIFQRDSLDVTAAEILSSCGPARLLSIDGGHHVECVLNDLRIADGVLASHGVAIVDDVFNQTWPSVVTGMAEYLTHDPALLPFATIPNKLLCARSAHVERYRDFLRRALADEFDHSDAFFRFPVDTYGMWHPPRAPRRSTFFQRTGRRLDQFIEHGPRIGRRRGTPR